MKAKELAPDNLGPKEDWAGNDIAIACPVCGKVFLVSQRLHGERHCPACGKSRGIVTGGKESGGKASIVWEDTPLFVMGQRYRRAQIKRLLGGSDIEFLPTKDGRVVCGCFTRHQNPDAPNVVVPGTGPRIERSAKLFCKQDYPVPVFIKHRPNEWEYVGHYKAERFSTDRAEIERNHHGSSTPLDQVTRVIYLKRAEAG